jgi:hypothetical protein
VPGRIGDVLTVTPAGGTTRYHVVLGDGLQEIPAVVASVLGAATGSAPREVGPAVTAVAPVRAELDVAGWPAAPERWVEPAEAPVVCWTWSPDGSSVLVGTRPPVPEGASTVRLAQADGPGDRTDTVVLSPGGGGPVRASLPGQPAVTGTLWLVSATGVGYGVPDAVSATALGITRTAPAPEAALRLLPTGPPLDLGQARRVVDVPDGPGSGEGRPAAAGP